MNTDTMLGSLAALRSLFVAGLAQIDTMAGMVVAMAPPEPAQRPACKSCGAERLKTEQLMGNATITICLQCGENQ